MGAYAYLMCHDCHQLCFLGKAYRSGGRPVFFQLGALRALNWKQKKLNQVLWKFLAEHCSHRLDVRLDEEMKEEMFEYQSIGGDSGGDITFNEYLSDWLGLDPGKE
jgi:hypothetical protein